MSALGMIMIGDLSHRTGTKVNTIRFYEEIGLMPKATRTRSGRRTYTPGDIRRLAFIRHARGLGFSTEEIRSLMALADQPDQDCAEAAHIARRHLQALDQRIAQLNTLRAELGRVAQSCDGGRAADCSVIEAIAELHLEVS